eukprot:3729115-Pleurochrysis_carterae.AAC.4
MANKDLRKDSNETGKTEIAERLERNRRGASLGRGQLVDRVLVDVPRLGDAKVLGRLGDVHVEHLQSLPVAKSECSVGRKWLDRKRSSYTSSFTYTLWMPPQYKSNDQLRKNCIISPRKTRCVSSPEFVWTVENECFRRWAKIKVKDATRGEVDQAQRESQRAGGVRAGYDVQEVRVGGQGS